MERELLTTPEAHRLSGLSLTHLAALAREGKLEAKRYGRDWMIFKDSLDAYLMKERKPGPKGPKKQKPEQV
ncbi:MAG TPA: helix-turn-helix domain-containing protein [Ktedonobacteraceae bacterium]|nr:helix-turn-helix domain-containing protein [Ktedonobacteraceae bacterium]